MIYLLRKCFGGTFGAIIDCFIKQPAFYGGFCFVENSVNLTSYNPAVDERLPLKFFLPKAELPTVANGRRRLPRGMGVAAFFMKKPYDYKGCSGVI